MRIDIEKRAQLTGDFLRELGPALHQVVQMCCGETEMRSELHPIQLHWLDEFLHQDFAGMNLLKRVVHGSDVNDVG